MRLTAFRVQNFRSILDTEWQYLSVDGLTVLVGQNESGKTSVLEGIAAFQADAIKDDDLREPQVYPTISLQFHCDHDDVGAVFGSLPGELRLADDETQNELTVRLTRQWTSLTESVLMSDHAPMAASHEDNDPPDEALRAEAIAATLRDSAPMLILFESRSGLLPDSIPLQALLASDSGQEGLSAAKNAVAVAELDAESLVNASPRLAANAVSDANRRMNRQLSSYWQQNIGTKLKVQLEAELKHDQAGVLSIHFWVKDGQHRLYPHQRSLGLRWYLSFFLQMLAARDFDVVYLVDEPGAGLHAKAQSDVLRLFEDLRRDFPIVYTTHSPYLIDKARVGRISAVQRVDAEDDRCPTTFVRAHQLGAASRDALSPLYTAMGIDFSHQDVVAADRNLLLEEISAYYYLHAFFRLFEPEAETPHMLPATGADNVPCLANLMLGWGLQFAILLDDDQKGREVHARLRAETFAEDAEAAHKRVVRTPGHCIEAIFTKKDYRTHVLRDEDAAIADICDHAKTRSKAADALLFFNSVRDGAILATDLQKTTEENTRKLLTRILVAVELPDVTSRYSFWSSRRSGRA